MARTKLVNLTVRIEQETVERLDEAAKHLDLPRSEIARMLVVSGIAAIEGSQYRILLPLRFRIDGTGPGESVE